MQPTSLKVNLICFCVLIHSVQSHVETVVGSTAELKCVTRPTHDDVVQLILWYRSKDGTGPPFYTVDARNSDTLTSPVHKIAPEYRGRVFFSISASSEPSILSITPVREDDDGFYSCRVDYKWARTEVSGQRLFVVGELFELLTINFMRAFAFSWQFVLFSPKIGNVLGRGHDHFSFDAGIFYS